MTLAAWYATSKQVEEKALIYGSTPFLRVTNREYALFLWQNPEFMRQNMKRKQGYLEAWGDNLVPSPSVADEWVQAPIDALFLYHTWHRLVGSYYYPRPILLNEFLQFLTADPEWHPKLWKAAPDEYKQLMAWIEEGIVVEDLRQLSYQEFPLIVRQAFQGWKNYTKERDQINKVKPTWRQMWTFIDRYPNFRRPFWINLVRQTSPGYLDDKGAAPTEPVPPAKMDGLLKNAIFNYLKDLKTPL